MNPLNISPDRFATLMQEGVWKKGNVFTPIHQQAVLSIPLPSQWEAYSYCVVTLKVEEGNQPHALLDFMAGSGNIPLTMHYRFLVGCRVSIPFPISAFALQAPNAFLPPHPGVCKGGLRGHPITHDQVRALRLTIRGEGLGKVHLDGISFCDAFFDTPVEGEAIVDMFGQRKGRDWPGKAHREEELVTYLHSEREEALQNGRFPEGWSRYGGWLEKQFEATGWFRTHHDGRRWWLVDPDGYAFFSNGMCYGHRAGIFGLTNGLNALHDWLPEPNGEHADAWITAENIPQHVVRNGLEGASQTHLVNYTRANLIRAFGAGWWGAFADITAARLRRWGFNTIGVGVNDYGDERTRDFLAKAKIPYVLTFKFFPLTQQRIFRDFPDVFNPAYESLAKDFAERELTPWMDDPYLVGYFVTNEPEWYFSDVNLAERLMAHPEPLASKRVFIEWLQKRYSDVSALNAAWHTQYADFNALNTPCAGLDSLTEASAADCKAFHGAMIKAYGETVSNALRRVDANHLNLGMRYAHADPEKLGQSAHFFDVFSFNCYAHEPATNADALGKAIGMPVLVGEWHFGAQDSGLDAWGLLYTENQAQRAQAIGFYSETATQSKHLVGIHYFEYNDQPLLGRYDGECYNIGLVDVCNRPYPLVAAECARFARRMYPLLEGRLSPDRSPTPTHTIL